MAIPEFPEFMPIGLEHKLEVDRAFAQTEPTISEFTFTNLFMWRYYYNLSVSRILGHILFLARPAGEQPFFYPPWGQGDSGQVVRRCLQFLAEKWGRGYIGRVSQDYIEKYANSLEGLEIIPDSANDDYVYSSQDLIFLKGRKYHGKRNAIRKSQGKLTYEYRTIDRELIPLCLELQDRWGIQRQRELYSGLMEEEWGVREVFGNYEALGVKGGAIVVEGRVQAFSLGEGLNQDSFVVHVEKANPSIPVLYAVINQQFAQNEGSAYDYISREQDLGHVGLRKAKKSYHPAFMVSKFKVGFKA